MCVHLQLSIVAHCGTETKLYMAWAWPVSTMADIASTGPDELTPLLNENGLPHEQNKVYNKVPYNICISKGTNLRYQVWAIRNSQMSCRENY